MGQWPMFFNFPFGQSESRARRPVRELLAEAQFDRGPALPTLFLRLGSSKPAAQSSATSLEREPQRGQAAFILTAGFPGALGQLPSGLKLQLSQMPQANPVRNQAVLTGVSHRPAPRANDQLERKLQLGRDRSVGRKFELWKTGHRLTTSFSPK